MNSYIYPIEQAAIQFPIVALLLTLPYMIFQYRKHGSISPLRTVILFSFFFYLMGAFYMTILPLPDPASVAANAGPFIQLIPFRFVADFLRETTLQITDASTYLPALKQGVFYEPIFNILLTLPFGIYLGYYFRVGVKKAILFALLLSLFFEVTQLTGIYGVYAKPYRIFDVDDLMLNTLGGYLGWLIGNKIGERLPGKAAMDRDTNKKASRVGYARRFAAFLIDVFLVSLLSSLLSIVVTNERISIAICYFSYFVFLQWLLKGKTPGKAAVRIKTVSMRFPFVVSLIIKYGPPYLILLYLQITSSLTANLLGLPLILVFISYVVIILFLFIDWITSFRRGKRTWYEMLSHTKNISTFTPAKET